MRRMDCLEREGHARRRCDQEKTKTMEDDGCVPWISPLELERDPWVGVGVNHTVRFFWKMRNSFGYRRSALADLTTYSSCVIKILDQILFDDDLEHYSYNYGCETTPPPSYHDATCDLPPEYFSPIAPLACQKDPRDAVPTSTGTRPQFAPAYHVSGIREHKGNKKKTTKKAAQPASPQEQPPAEEAKDEPPPEDQNGGDAGGDAGGGGGGGDDGGGGDGGGDGDDAGDATSKKKTKKKKKEEEEERLKKEEEERIAKEEEEKKAAEEAAAAEKSNDSGKKKKTKVWYREPSNMQISIH